jgi:MFS family permease
VDRALADRVDKHHLLIAAQLLLAGQAAALGAVVLTGVDTVASAYGLTLGYGLLLAVETPARRAFVAELVDEDGIPNAVSVNGVITAAGRVVGPLCAGALIASAGIGWCFIANAVGYLIALTGLVLMRRSEPRITEPSGEAAAVRAGDNDAKKLADAFNIRTVRQLGENKFFNVARALVELENFG